MCVVGPRLVSRGPVLRGGRVAVQITVKVSQYFDSITLMQVARSLQALPGIDDAALVMGTEANKRLLEQLGGLSGEAEAASPGDLVVMIKGDAAAVVDALAQVDGLLARRPGAAESAHAHRPRTLRSAVRAAGDANLAVISVAGAYAAAEAWDALRHGLNVLLFSDNVSLEDEIALKTYAVGHGLLLMGPGAGTAIINGAALGFANVVPRGPVGIVSAAGTGLQEVSTLLAKQGVGITQGIGVGGRDLSDAVGGLMTLHALQALQRDPATQVIVAISKLPSPAVVDKVVAQLTAHDKPAVVIFMGAGQAASVDAPHLYRASTLQEAALAAATLVQGGDAAAVRGFLAGQAEALRTLVAATQPTRQPGQQYLRGLFSGGTLCEEAMSLWQDVVGQVWSNAPLTSECKLPDSNRSRGHCAIDLGEEEFTVGRPHPMIDHDLCIRRLLQEAADPSVAVIQLDVVLGYGAHPDPAGALAPAIRQARADAAAAGRTLTVITALTGTDHDPQPLAVQKKVLEAAGALVLDSNAAASQLAALMAGSA